MTYFTESTTEETALKCLDCQRIICASSDGRFLGIKH